MAEQELNGPQISAGFKEMYSECVPQRMRSDEFRETGQTMCFLAGCLYGVLRDRPVVMNAWEQPFLRPSGFPVVAQNLQQHGREHHISIFAALALHDANDHPGTVNSSRLQANSF